MNTCSVRGRKHCRGREEEELADPNRKFIPLEGKQKAQRCFRQQSGIQPGRPSLYEVVSWQAESFFVGFTLETTERWDLKKGAGEVSSLVKQPEV